MSCLEESLSEGISRTSSGAGGGGLITCNSLINNNNKLFMTLHLYWYEGFGSEMALFFLTVCVFTDPVLN
jgi:hypothetical protein